MSLAACSRKATVNSTSKEIKTTVLCAMHEALWVTQATHIFNMTRFVRTLFKEQVFMKNNQNMAQAKKSARALFKALKRQGLALSLGQALDVQAQVAGAADWNAYSAQLTVPSVSTTPVLAAVPSIEDVNFQDVHAVIFGDQCFDLDWREEAVLAYRGMKGKPGHEDWEDWEDSTALALSRKVNGFDVDEYLTLGDLEALKWDAKEQLFRDPAGRTFQFFLSTAFGASAVPAPAVTQVVAEVAPAPSVAKYAMFQIKLETGALKYVAALNVAQAETQALTQGHLVPGEGFTVKEVDSELYGPFLVEVNGGYYNEFESLNKAIQVAKGLLDADDELDEARVVTAQGTSLISFDA